MFPSEIGPDTGPAMRTAMTFSSRSRLHALRLCMAAALLVCLHAAAPAQLSQAVPTNPDSVLQDFLNRLEGTPISLRDAVQQALTAATSVRTAEAALAAARGTARREAGAFDPELFFSFNRLDNREPAASFFSGASVLSTRQDNLSGGLRIALPTGTSIEAALNTFRLETNSAFAFLNPQYTTNGIVNFRQPLLGGFWVSAAKRSAQADRFEEAAQARYDQAALAMSTQVEQLYWDLYAAERDLAVQQLTRDRGRAFLTETETRARTGLVGPNQVASARTFLAQQEINLLDSEEQLDRLSDAFASLIGRRPDQGKVRFLTSDTPPPEVSVEDVDVLIRKALEHNLDLRAAASDVEAGRALARAAFWEALPQIDLTASLGGNGLGGTPQAVIFNADTLRTTRAGSFNDAVSSALKREFPSWSVGVEVRVPIGLRSGLGEQDRLDAEVEIAEQRRIQVARLLEEQVRAGYRDILNGRRRLEAARAGVDAAQEQVRIGLIEFQNGRTTAFELVRLGEDFAVAQQRYTQALVRSARAAVQLKQLTSGAFPASQ
jgi:outer membrane protein